LPLDVIVNHAHRQSSRITMSQRLVRFCMLGLLAASAQAALLPGTISGTVRNSRGTPQMGAVVEIFSAGSRGATVFTDDRGRYRAPDLLAGTYGVKVSAPAFLPALRENVSLRAGAHIVVNLTLSTLVEAVRLLPQRRGPEQAEDDWKWTLRSAANRPILRVVDGGPLLVSSAENGGERGLRAQVAFLAGSQADGFGGPAGDLSTVFSVERSLFSSGTLSFNGNLGYGDGPPTGALRAAYSHRLGNGSHPELAFTLRRFATPGSAAHQAALRALTLTLSDGFTLADFLDLSYGGELEAIQFRGRVMAFRPFGSVSAHLSPNTVLEYRYATSQPTTRAAKGFDSAPADLSESGPRMSLSGFVPALERARHHEISISRRHGKNNFQLAAYADRIHNAALTGVGEVTADGGQFLPDVYSGTFTYSGGDFSARGLRAVYPRKLGANLTGTLDYAYGGVLDVTRWKTNWEVARSSLRPELRHAVAVKFAGRVPHGRTQVLASYRWLSGGAVTPVDAFNSSPGQADPFLNLFVRQPIPGGWLLPAGLEALIDVRNLLAQGYVPLIGPDGRTLYLVQSARAIRGGVAFTF